MPRFFDFVAGIAIHSSGEEKEDTRTALVTRITRAMQPHLKLRAKGEARISDGRRCFLVNELHYRTSKMSESVGTSGGHGNGDQNEKKRKKEILRLGGRTQWKRARRLQK